MVQRYYAFKKDLSCAAYSEFGKAADVNPWFIIELKEHYKTGTTSDYEFALYGPGKSIGGTDYYYKDYPIKIGDWSLLNARPAKSYFDTENIGFDVADPNGLIRFEFFGKAISENGVKKAVEFLDKVTKFKSWEHYFESLDDKKKKVVKKKTK